MPVTTLKSLNNQQNFLRILIFSVVTIMIWIAFTIFRTQQTTQISPELQKMALPLTPTIDMDVISRIDQKKSYSDQELSSFPVYGLVIDKTGQQTIQIINGQGAGQTTTTTATPASESAKIAAPEVTTEPAPSPETSVDTTQSTGSSTSSDTGTAQ